VEIIEILGKQLGPECSRFQPSSSNAKISRPACPNSVLDPSDTQRQTRTGRPFSVLYRTRPAAFCPYPGGLNFGQIGSASPIPTSWIFLGNYDGNNRSGDTARVLSEPLLSSSLLGVFPACPLWPISYHYHLSSAAWRSSLSPSS